MLLSTRAVASGGLGEYPGYYCYDNTRPSWLPYWIDTPTESLCKWNPKTIAGNIYACATGDPTCGTPPPSAQDPTLPGPGIAAPGQPTNIPVCGQFTAYNPASGRCEFNVTSPATLILLAVGLTVLLLVMRS